MNKFQIKWPTYKLHRILDQKGTNFRMVLLTVVLLGAYATMYFTNQAWWSTMIVGFIGLDRWVYLLIPCKYTT